MNIEQLFLNRLPAALKSMIQPRAPISTGPTASPSWAAVITMAINNGSVIDAGVSVVINLACIMAGRTVWCTGSMV